MQEDNIIEIISNLNFEIYETCTKKDRYGNKETIIEIWGVPLFEYETDGFIYQSVKFLDHVIWDSENDERVWNEEKDEPEPMEGFLRRTANQLISDISKIKL